MIGALDTTPIIMGHSFGGAFTQLLLDAGFGAAGVTIDGAAVKGPQHLHIEDEGADLHSRPFQNSVAHAHIQLADAPLEAELIRKRCGVLVSSPTDDKHPYIQIVDVSGSFGYVAAPITVGGRVVGMLHADRPQPDGIVTMDHLDWLEAFAECLAVSFESAVLEETAAKQQAAVGNLSARVNDLLRRSAGSTLWPSPSTITRSWDDVYYRGDQTVPALTAREREIMSYVATGPAISRSPGA